MENLVEGNKEETDYLKSVEARAKARRQKDFSRRALIAAGWAVPVVLSVGLNKKAVAAGSPHGDGHNDHHNDTHLDRSHQDTHTDQHADEREVHNDLHTDRHADDGDGILEPGEFHDDIHTDNTPIPHTDNHADQHTDIPHGDQHVDS